MPEINGHYIAPSLWQITEKRFRRQMAEGADFASTDALPIRAQNVLRWMGITKKEEAAGRLPSDFLRQPNCGRATTAAIVMWSSPDYSPPS